MCLREAQTPVFEDIGERFIEGDRRRPPGVSSQEGGVAPQLREFDRAEQVGVLDEAHAGIGQAEEKACQLADASVRYMRSVLSNFISNLSQNPIIMAGHGVGGTIPNRWTDS